MCDRRSSIPVVEKPVEDRRTKSIYEGEQWITARDITDQGYGLTRRYKVSR